MEKYQAQKNTNDNTTQFLNNLDMPKTNNSNGQEVPEKTNKEKKEEAGAKAAKVAAKAAAEYYAPGMGGQAVEMISQTKLGQKILDRAGKDLARKPLIGKQLQKLDENGGLDMADQATDMMSGGTPGSTGSNLNTTPSNSNLTPSSGDGLNNSSKTNLGTSTTKADSKTSPNTPSTSSSNSEIKQTSNDNKKDLMNSDLVEKLKRKLQLFLLKTVGVYFGIFILLVIIICGKDFGNLDLTNKSEAMGTYVPGSMETATPANISQISGEVIKGKSGNILSGEHSLAERLGSEGIQKLNESIANSAYNAGYGTGAAPAAAAQALITNLLNNDIVLPYFWGGGHGAMSTGVNESWGTMQYVSAGGSSTSFSNQPYGLDCSGFVSWALYNGGCKNFTPILAADFKSLGPGIEFQETKTGDIAASETHVVLILENRGDKLLCAEAKSSKYGVIYSEKSRLSMLNYKFVDMSGYYQQNCS